MNKSKRLLITAAAMAGLYSGSLATRAFAAEMSSDKAGQSAPKSDKAKDGCAAHSCKGQNGCKGHGGCKTGDNGCAGKNSCKGKGGCEVKAAKMESKEKKG